MKIKQQKKDTIALPCNNNKKHDDKFTQGQVTHTQTTLNINVLNKHKKIIKDK